MLAWCIDQVQYNWPRPQSLMPNIFTTRDMKKFLKNGHFQKAGKRYDAIVQQYCKDHHWVPCPIVTITYQSS